MAPVHFLSLLLLSLTARAVESPRALFSLDEYVELLTSGPMRGMNSVVPAQDREVRELAAIHGKELVTQAIRIVVEKPRFTGKVVQEESFGPVTATEDARELLAAKIGEIKKKIRR